MLRRFRALELPRLVPHYLVGLAVAWALKSFYSRAGAEDLSWILEPASRLAGLLGGITFEKETGAGWVSHEHGVIVGPACAGLNFLIIAFATCYFSVLHRFSRPAARAAWLPASLAAAFALTIVVNAQRIIATVHMKHWDIYGDVITPQRVHRAAGAVVYCFALLLFHEAIARIVPPRSASARLRAASPLVPVAWYLSVMLAGPILNRAWRNAPGEFLEHSVLVAACSLLAAAAFVMLRMRTKRRQAPPADEMRC